MDKRKPWRCPHCGSDKGTWFSRTEPMGDICEDCGKDVDEPRETSGEHTPNEQEQPDGE